jgi:Uma2 family endonuclease
MSTTHTLLTLEAFSKLPEYDERTGERYELDHGELITLPPQPRIHEIVKNLIGQLLMFFLRDHGLAGQVLIESGYVLDEDSWRRPDVSYVRRKLQGSWDEPLEFAPDLSIEVVSPSDSEPALKRKADHFLASGSKTVWLIYPNAKEAQILRVGVRAVKLGPEDFLEEPDLLPGFRVKVRELFP